MTTDPTAPNPAANDEARHAASAPVPEVPIEVGAYLETGVADMPRLEAPAPRRSFSLASLMGLMTLFCVFLPVSIAWPGLGIVLAVLIVPAWLRTALALRRRGPGFSNQMGNRVNLFVASLAITFVTLASMGVAFCMVCMPATLLSMAVGANYAAFVIGILVGSIAAIAVGYVIGKQLWKVNPSYEGVHRPHVGP